MGYGLTSDIWTDNFIRTFYVSLTIHYIKEGQLVNRLLGLSAFTGERCTGENIQHKVLNILNFHELPVEKAVFVTDRGRNMKKAFEPYQNISCINHLLNNVLEQSVKAVPELNEMCEAATKLVKFFKKSGENSGLQTSLKSFSPTRWNTVFYLLSSVQKNWTEITNILQSKQQLSRLNGISLNHLDDILKVLEVFEESSKELEGENYPTLHLVLPHVYRLKETCTRSESLTFVSQFKEKLNELVDTVVLENLTIYHELAVFLFPPTNKLISFNQNDKLIIKRECKSLMSIFISEVDGHDQPSTSANPPPTRKSQLFTAFLHQSQDSNEENNVNNEIIKYEATNVLYYDEFSVFQWWHLHQFEFPLLYKVASSLLVIPASSAASERVFSKARHLISEKRNVIGSNSFSIHQIMFLHNNMDINILN